MADYYNKGLDMTFSLYENKIMYNEGSGSVTAKRECTEYWFNQQNEIGSLEEISQISYIVQILRQWEELEKISLRLCKLPIR